MLLRVTDIVVISVRRYQLYSYSCLINLLHFNKGCELIYIMCIIHHQKQFLWWITDFTVSISLSVLVTTMGPVWYLKNRSSAKKVLNPKGFVGICSKKIRNFKFQGRILLSVEGQRWNFLFLNNRDRCESICHSH